MVHFGNEWDTLLRGEFDKEYYQNLRRFLITEYRSQRIFPHMNDIFSAMKLTCYSRAKVVLLGQDPYHGEGQAHGLCFSVRRGVAKPPSLENILKELSADLGLSPPQHGCLAGWAQNGVLLLNTVLTVRSGQPNSHRGMGWEQFTDRVIELLNRRRTPLVFLLWGANARAKKALLTESRHLVLEAAHPSPLSAYQGFFGCRHFSKANAFLVQNGQAPVDWSLD